MAEEMRKYELLYIHPGTLDEEGVKKVDDRLAEIGERFGARVFYRDDWGVKPLAYRVKRYLEGRYILMRFAVTTECLQEFERHLRIMDEVIKFITVRLPDDYDESKDQPAEPDEVAEEPVVTDDVKAEVEEETPVVDEVAETETEIKAETE
ncbi:MAG: 30S ribosomal protein S6 [Pseudomonadota bacterium]|nr:30S ribosomal protein S6 [Pseudomonadota bacterium]